VLKGKKGEKGDPGAPGPMGPSDLYSARATAVKAADNTTMLSLDVPAGSYLVTAKAMLVNNNGAASEFDAASPLERYRIAAGPLCPVSRVTPSPSSTDTRARSPRR